jgi:hypothetical protein
MTPAIPEDKVGRGLSMCGATFTALARADLIVEHLNKCVLNGAVRSLYK